jgi:hypothetical protein
VSWFVGYFAQTCHNFVTFGGRACNCLQNCIRIFDLANFSACENDSKKTETMHKHPTHKKEAEVKRVTYTGITDKMTTLTLFY